MSVLFFSGGGPGRLRTYDNPVMSRGLYQLSYGSNSGNISGLPCLGKKKGALRKKNSPPHVTRPPEAGAKSLHFSKKR